MSKNFAEEYRSLFSQGLVDEAYPLESCCVQLPNGWYGINSVLNHIQRALMELGYEEEMVPSVSTNTIYNEVPKEFKTNVVESALQVTHTGLHKLDEPLLMSARPDLIVPQIEKILARSYRNLPIKRIIGGFRYTNPSKHENYPLITDIEVTTKDVTAILFTEKEYKKEIKTVMGILMSFLKDQCKLNAFCVRRGYIISVFAALPNHKTLEIATLRLYGQKLAETLKFSVLSPSNTQTSPYIFNLTLTSRIFAAIVLTHSHDQKVVLPKYIMRAHGVSFGIDCSSIKSLRIDLNNQQFTSERFQKLRSQGFAFALVPSDDKVRIIKCCGEEVVVSKEDLEAALNEYIDQRESHIDTQSKQNYADWAKEIQFSSEPIAAECFSVLGAKIDETFSTLEPIEPISFAIAQSLVPLLE